MTLDPSIEPARIGDAEQILELQHLCYQAEAERYDDYTIPPLTETRSSLLSEYDTHTILVARLGDEVVGSVRGRLADGHCLIGRLMVHPRLQRRGLGTRLMRAIEDHFAACDRYELFTGHLSEGNLRLYHRLGYTKFREESVSPRLRPVYLEKLRTSRYSSLDDFAGRIKGAEAPRERRHS